MSEPSTSVVHTLPAHEAIVARFLARVRRLTPRQWGELDAVAQREYGGGAIGACRRARRRSAIFGTAPLDDVLTGSWLCRRHAPDALAEVYAPVEPFIPDASIA